MFRAQSVLMAIVVVVAGFYGVSAEETPSLRRPRRSILQVESSFVESLWGREQVNGT